MNKSKFYFYSALLVAIATLVLLFTGSSLLTLSLNSANTIPLGTFITWAGIIALPMSIYWGVKELRTPTTGINKILAICLKICIVLAILWVPIAYLLAGNLSFSFTEKATFQGGQAAMRWFWRLSYGIGIVAMLTLSCYWISLIFKPSKG